MCSPLRLQECQPPPSGAAAICPGRYTPCTLSPWPLTILIRVGVGENAWNYALKLPLQRILWIYLFSRVSLKVVPWYVKVCESNACTVPWFEQMWMGHVKMYLCVCAWSHDCVCVRVCVCVYVCVSISELHAFSISTWSTSPKGAVPLCDWHHVAMVTPLPDIVCS